MQNLAVGVVFDGTLDLIVDVSDDVTKNHWSSFHCRPRYFYFLHDVCPGLLRSAFVQVLPVEGVAGAFPKSYFVEVEQTLWVFGTWTSTTFAWNLMISML
jgi:hypothetical protein